MFVVNYGISNTGMLNQLSDMSYTVPPLLGYDCLTKDHTIVLKNIELNKKESNVTYSI